jgi:hypothetical protein
MNGMSLPLLVTFYGLSPSVMSRQTKYLLRHPDAHHLQTEQAQLAATLDDLELIQSRVDRIFRNSEDARSPEFGGRIEGLSR